jgi:hypothetical protein
VLEVVARIQKQRVHRNDEDMELRRRLENPVYLDRFGFKVYSQNDEDGIINEIFNRIGTTSKVFVEFGTQDGLESNGHFLLCQGWKALWIDCDKKSLAMLKKYFYEPIRRNQLKVVNAFITRDNIDTLISSNLSFDLPPPPYTQV